MSLNEEDKLKHINGFDLNNIQNSINKDEYNELLKRLDYIVKSIDTIEF